MHKSLHEPVKWLQQNVESRSHADFRKHLNKTIRCWLRKASSLLSIICTNGNGYQTKQPAIPSLKLTECRNLNHRYNSLRATCTILSVPLPKANTNCIRYNRLQIMIANGLSAVSKQPTLTKFECTHPLSGTAENEITVFSNCLARKG